MSQKLVRYCGSDIPVYCPLIGDMCNPECICLLQNRNYQGNEYEQYLFTFTCNQFGGARLWIDDGVKA